MFNTAYIGLFDRSLLHMSLNQLELALKNTTFKSRTPLSMYQFDPFFNSIWEIIKTFYTQIFFCFLVWWTESEKEVICRKKVGVTEHPTKIFTHQVNAKVICSMFCWVFESVRALENYVARAWPMNSVRTNANVLKRAQIENINTYDWLLYTPREPMKREDRLSLPQVNQV